MLDETLFTTRNVISFAQARALRKTRAAQPLRARLCCHCGAALGDGEREEECSGAGFNAMSVTVRRRAE